jgi:large subunit ribosomal protein L21
MKYAVIKTGGKQYKVSEGDILEVERLKGEKDQKVTFDNVLLLVSDSTVKLGKPFIQGEKVEGKLLENIRGEKVRVSKFKSKVRFRRTTGFRASISKVLVEKIGGKEVKATETKLPKKTQKK